ncbi:MAG: LysR family transcriptional regulator [Dorea sp.]
MTFEQLEYFIAVVEQDTFFDAAERLHISQSSLSKQIIKLEKELGIQLLDRSRRSASLTEAGKTFYQEAQKLRTQYQEMLREMNRYQTHKKLRIGTLPILTQYHLTPRFQAFSATHPGVRLHISEVEEIELLRGLEDGTYDLIICREHMIQNPKYSCRLLTEDKLVAALPIDHPLLDDPISQSQPLAIPLTDLAEESFLLMNQYTAIHQLCLKLFQEADIQPEIVRTARVESIISAVAIGEGISLLPESNFEVFHHENVTAVPLDPPVYLPVVVAGEKEKMSTALCKEFIRSITSAK